MKKKKNEKNKISQLTVVGHSGYNVVSTSLPSNFFEGLLIMEMELNNEFTMEKLLALVSQYSLAIEFYLQTDPMKAKAYQNRMEYLLTNKDTLVQLSRIKSGKKDENENTNQKIKKNKDSNKTKQYVKFQQEGLKEEEIFRRVNTVLNQGNKKIDEKKNVKSIISNDIKKQDESWKEKLQIKKKKTLKNSVKPGSLHLKKRMSKDNSLEIGKINTSKDEITSQKSEEIKDEKEEEKKVEEKIEEEKKVEENKEEGKKDEIKEVENEIKKEDEKKEEEKEGEVKQENERKEIHENKEEVIDNIEEVIDNKEEVIEKKEEVIENKEEVIENKEDVNENKEDNNQGDLENIIFKLMKEQEEEEKKDEENTKKEEEKQDEEEDLIFNKIVESSPEPKDIQPVIARKSIVDEDVTRKIEPDEEIKKPIDEQIQSLKNIILNLNKIKSKKENGNDDEDDDDDSQNDENNKNSENSNSNQNLNKIIQKDENNTGHGLMDANVNKIPAKFRSTYYQVESLMIDYMNNFNEFFYQDVFEQFSSGLKELYELKYKKYIEIRNEYHNQIKENEYLLENDENLNEEKKLEIQQTIDSLNEEQQHQIATVEDEFNRKIMDKISEFKLNTFKTNSGIQLLEEQIKLDIYALINDSFY